MYACVHVLFHWKLSNNRKHQLMMEYYLLHLWSMRVTMVGCLNKMRCSSPKRFNMSLDAILLHRNFITSHQNIQWLRRQLYRWRRRWIFLCHVIKLRQWLNMCLPSICILTQLMIPNEKKWNQRSNMATPPPSIKYGNPHLSMVVSLSLLLRSSWRLTTTAYSSSSCHVKILNKEYFSNGINI